MKAQDLIAKKQKSTEVSLPQDLIDEIRKILDYNDICTSTTARISKEAICELCRENGYPMSRQKLTKILKKYFNRAIC